MITIFGYSVKWGDVIVFLSFFIGGLLLGFIVEKIILAKLHKVALKTKWEGDDIIIASLKGIPIFMIGTLGLYLGIHHISPYIKIPPIVDQVLLAFSIFLVTIFLARLSSGFIRLWTRSAEGRWGSMSIFPTLVTLIVYIIGLLVILQTFGISITPILTALGVGGLAVALALKDTLSNLFAGIHIIAARQIKPGDYIKLESGEEGKVEDITWRNTVIRALSNNLIIVPNSKVASSIIINYFKPIKDLSVYVDVGVSYDSDLEKVERVTKEVAKEVMRDMPGGVDNFEPLIRYKSFGESSINFTVILRANEFVNQYALKHEFIKRLHKRYQEEGITIPYPIRTVYIKNDKSNKQK